MEVSCTKPSPTPGVPAVSYASRKISCGVHDMHATMQCGG